MHPTSFRLELDASTHTMYAEYIAETDAPHPDRDALVHAAAQQGWGASAFDDTAVSAFLDRCHASDEAFRVPVGEVRNGHFELELDADGTYLLFDLHPPRGGRPVRLSEVRNALAQRGIVFGLKQLALLDALKAGHCRRVVIAEGEPPKPGIPARFESLLDQLKPKPPIDDDTALIDYRDLGSLLLVSPGTPLMRRIPARVGQPGTDVFGKPVPPPAIFDTPFASNLPGTQIDENDPDLLRAAIAGVPKIQGEGKVIVDPVVVVNAVDLTTGNVRFDGTLQVKGDITAGMEVRVSGDVVVKGTIEAAHIYAGGDVTVNGGIIGVQTQGAGQVDERVAHIEAGGSVKARFMVSAFISARGSVSAEREIRQCDVSSGETVIVGRPGSRDGRIIGGRIRALRAVRAAQLGAPTGTPTDINIGVNPHAPAQLEEVEAQQQRLIDEKIRVGQQMNLIEEGGITDPLKASQIRKDYSNLLREESELLALATRLSNETIPNPDARIDAFKAVYAGVTLHLGGRHRTFMEDQEGGRASIVENQIVVK